MMLILSVCIILGALLDMILTALTMNHLMVLGFGLLLLVINLTGNKAKKSVGRSLISLLVILAAVLTITGISSGKEPVDNETATILREAMKLEEEQGYEAALEFLQNKNIDTEWRKEITIRIGEIYMEQAIYLEGANTYYEVLRQIPDDMTIRHLYAKALYMNNDYHGTLREGMYMAKINPEYSDAYVLMGDAYKGFNDHFREIYYYKIAVDLDEASIVNRLRLAEAYGSSQSHEEANEQYEIAKELATTFEEDNLIYESYLRFADAEMKKKR